MLSQQGVMNAMEMIYDLYDQKIEALENELMELKSARNTEITLLQMKCPHIKIDVNHYVDYDRNRYTVTCKDCGKILLCDGDHWQYTKLLKARSEANANLRNP